ncbi:Alpha-L-Rha alpha-1,3-L-rhamnosyltransferase [hydrothermal vent metagenome]|uniref:Alpha-L-Rha alpha-1,3-L-rhamnosyltransferase n=1 Tax=hydrothermal vent metagenome TaxID=652676 RepID=A0A3B1DY07_9ZZZZ
MKVTILLSTYNAQKYIKAQLDSLFNQTYQDFKIITRDDNSKDNTIKILKSYDLEMIPSNKNIGAKASFSTLLEYATQNTSSDYFMFCDQDDIWKIDKIEKTLKKMQELENKFSDIALLVHSNLEIVNQDLQKINKSFWQFEQINPAINKLNRLLIQNTITGCTVMINKNLAQLATPVPDKAIMHDIWLGLVASEFGKIGFINKTLIKYRQHAQNTIGSSGFRMNYIINKLLQKNILQKNTLQAKAFLDTYKSKLEKKNIQMLEDLSTIESKSFWQKRKILLKHKLFKQGLIRNIGLFLKI